MSTLVTENSRFYRVKRGQKASEIQKILNLPAVGVFAGAILPVDGYAVHKAQPFESYESLAEKFGTTAEELEKCNGGKPLYPTCKVFVPLQNQKK